MRRHLTLMCLSAMLMLQAVYPLAQQGTAPGDWTYHGGDSGSTKYAPLDQITPGNVGSLRIAWRRPAVSPELTAAHPKLVVPRNFRATPLKADGMLFASNALGLAEGIEPETGRTVWTQEVASGELEGPGASRTLAYWRGDGGARVFAVRGAYLYALDPRSGKPITTFGSGGRVDLVAGLGPATTFRWSAPSPLVVRDVVIIGGQGGRSTWCRGTASRASSRGNATRGRTPAAPRRGT
jgi:quinoprotein glucose dehydrogenase